jgi:WhiB family transcriptional regulator, redox-sensing transcriptional regulator
MGEGSDGKEPVTTDWRDRRRCKGADPATFYPDDDDDPAEVAKAICGACIVRPACLEHAIVLRERLGVWGGTTAKERRRMIRRRRKAG